MMERIRHEVLTQAKIANVLISGSHTHHGPVIELTDRPGFGKGKFDSAVAYSKKLPTLLISSLASESAPASSTFSFVAYFVTYSKHANQPIQPGKDDARPYRRL